MNRVVRTFLNGVRRIDMLLGHRSSQRRILVDARTPVNFTMVAPVFRMMDRDPRVEFYFTASEEPERRSDIYTEARGIRMIHPKRAALVKFDAYVASDFIWAPLVRPTCRIQMFHGVGGKYGFDAPDRSMRHWHRLFFVNQRRLRNFIARGAIEPDSPAIRLVGMPKVDCLVNGTFSREQVITGLGLDLSRPTVLYAPTWSPASSLNAIGVDLIRAITGLPVNLIVKLHDRSRDTRERYSGGIDWVARLRPLLTPGRSVIADGHDISPYLVAADLMVTDHSSAGFEFLLRDGPIVRIHRPELIELAQIHADYVELLASVSESVTDVDGAIAAIERGLSNPRSRSDVRRHVAADLFHDPGNATARTVEELYDAVELAPPAAVPDAASVGDAEEPWQKSA
jgi:hypothetical protein